MRIGFAIGGLLSRARHGIVAGLVLGTAALTMPAQAQDAANFPTRPVTLLVPWAPGGSSDLASRLIANLLKKEMGWSVRIENRPGAGSAVGLQMLANAKPDGYTFGLVTSSVVTNPILGDATVNYSMFDPLRLTHISPGAIAVNSDSSLNSLNDLIEMAKKEPNRVRIGNTGTGATWHLLSMMIKDAADVEYVDVPYSSGSELLAAVLGGHIEGAIQSIAGWQANVASGDLKVLGISSSERMTDNPDIATFKEQGADISYGLFVGFVAPKGVPEDIRTKLGDALSKTVQKDEFKAFAKENGMIIVDQGPAEFTKLLESEDAVTRDLAAKHFKK